jgi:hypothetical protein
MSVYDHLTNILDYQIHVNSLCPPHPNHQVLSMREHICLPIPVFGQQAKGIWCFTYTVRSLKVSSIYFQFLPLSIYSTLTFLFYFNVIAVYSLWTKTVLLKIPEKEWLEIVLFSWFYKLCDIVDKGRKYCVVSFSESIASINSNFSISHLLFISPRKL